MSIAAVLFAVIVVVSLAGLYVSPRIIERSVFRPYWVHRGRRFETLVTSGFVHADLSHLIFNLITFYFFGFPLEHRIGGAAFAALYFIGLLVSDVGSYVKHRDDPEYGSIGASGAISAVLFASIVYFPSNSVMIFPLPVPIPAPLFAVSFMSFDRPLSPAAAFDVSPMMTYFRTLVMSATTLHLPPTVLDQFARLLELPPRQRLHSGGGDRAEQRADLHRPADQKHPDREELGRLHRVGVGGVLLAGDEPPYAFPSASSSCGHSGTSVSSSMSRSGIWRTSSSVR